MSTQLKYYLARNQKTFGPLSQEEVDSLRQSGQLSQYSWIFQEGDAQWAPTDPAPAIPQSHHDSQAAVLPEMPPALRSVPVNVPRAPSALRSVEHHSYRVILFDHHNAVSGWLVGAADGGCDIRSDQKGSDPLFVSKGTACLTLHDTRTGDCIKLRVRVAEIERVDRGWTYRLRWNAIPEILARTHSRGSDASVAA